MKVNQLLVYAGTVQKFLIARFMPFAKQDIHIYDQKYYF